MNDEEGGVLGINSDKLKRKLDLKKATKERRKQRKIAHGDEECSITANLNETEYHFEGGFRLVRPYHFTYDCYAKQRWLGKTLGEVMSNEFFKDAGPQNYERSIEDGLIKVNSHVVTSGYVIKDSDKISHYCHKHEGAVLDLPVKVIHETEDLFVVDKPCSIPIHPCGPYRHNTICFILARQGHTRQRIVHRLDRLTSGVLVFAKNYTTATELSKLIQDQDTRKTYLAKVKGVVPWDAFACEKPIGPVCLRSGIYQAVACDSTRIMSSEPWKKEDGLKTKPQNADASKTSPSSLVTEAKVASTRFVTLHRDVANDCTIVRCDPHTGRTHQIRVHLQHLGYPIIGDNLYNDPVIWGPSNGKHGDYGERTKADIMEAYATRNPVHSRFGNPEKTPLTPADDETNKSQADPFFDPKCRFCPLGVNLPDKANLSMCLHAFRYRFGEKYDFISPLPAWIPSQANLKPDDDMLIGDIDNFPSQYTL